MQPLRPSVIYWSPICTHTVTVPLFKKNAVLCTLHFALRTSQPSTTSHIFFALQNSSFRVVLFTALSGIIMIFIGYLLLMICVFALTLPCTTLPHTTHSTDRTFMNNFLKILYFSYLFPSHFQTA